MNRNETIVKIIQDNTPQNAALKIDELFEAKSVNLGGNPEQWVINTNIEELNDLKYLLARYDDFWEWYEDEYGETKNEVWDKFENQESPKLFYRIAHEQTQQGLWYDSKGNFTGLIHNEFNFCMNKDLPMPFDQDLVGWLSATDSLEDLFNWFSKEDIERLEIHGWFITVYEAEKVKQYKNHLVICQETSRVKEILPLSSL